MAASTVIPQFFKLLCRDDCSSNEMRVPRKFTNEHSQHLSGMWLLTIRNGYKINTVYDSSNSTLSGIHDLYVDFGLMGGEVLVFEHVDSSVFKVYIIGLDRCEIKYPPIVHSTQTCAPIPVRSSDGGWRFLKFFRFAPHNMDEIDIPTSFVAEFAPQMPSAVKYVLNCSREVLGYYDDFRGRLYRFRKVCKALGLSDFTSLDCVLFTYDNGRKFNLSLFDGRAVDIKLDPAVMASGDLCFSLRYPSQFSIEVQPCHMLPYCYGVDVCVDYFRVSLFWKKKDLINVYDGARAWPLEVRKRKTGKRTTILAGWTKFRDDLHLDVGDRCWFIWIDESYNRFRVEVHRAVIELD